VWNLSLQNPEATHEIGRALGAAAQSGCVVALSGPLGAGKTCLSQGVAAGLGVTGPVTSPTFIILAVYDGGRLPLHHADLYRLGDPEELRELGLEEAFAPPAVSLVEWADRFPELLPADHLAVSLDYADGDTRSLSAEAHGPRSQALLEAARAAWMAR